MIETLGIIGVGLLGGSIALAARERRLAKRIIGVSRSTVILAERNLELMIAASLDSNADDEHDPVGEVGVQLERLRKSQRERIAGLEQHVDEQRRLIEQATRVVGELLSTVSSQLPAIEDTVECAAA